MIEVGQRFGRGVVIEREVWIYRSKNRVRGSKLKCDCGVVYTAIWSDLLRKDGKRKKSCGCGNRENRANLGQRIKTHGLRDHPLYRTWLCMLRRCNDVADKDYPNYGGRGITVCPQWFDVSTFIGDIERLIGPRPDKHTLDRIHVNDNYEPGKVRWATGTQQILNSRPRRTNTSGHIGVQELPNGKYGARVGSSGVVTNKSKEFHNYVDAIYWRHCEALKLYGSDAPNCCVQWPYFLAQQQVNQ